MYWPHSWALVWNIYIWAWRCECVFSLSHMLSGIILRVWNYIVRLKFQHIAQKKRKTNGRNVTIFLFHLNISWLSPVTYHNNYTSNVSNLPIPKINDCEFFVRFFLYCFRNPNVFQKQETTLPISKEKNKFRSIVWDEYDPVHQKYLELGKCVFVLATGL